MCAYRRGEKKGGGGGDQLIERAAYYKKLAQKGGACSREYSMLEVFSVTQRTNTTVSSSKMLLLITWF